jgi:hypothetical protein
MTTLLLTLGGAFFCAGWAFGIVVAREPVEHDQGPTPLTEGGEN